MAHSFYYLNLAKQRIVKLPAYDSIPMVRSNFGLSLLEIRLDQERGIVLRSKNGLKLLMSRLSHQSEPVKFTLTGSTLHNETVII